MPFSPILGNAFKVRILRKSKSRSLYAPSRHTREAICGVTDHSQEVRDRLGFHSKLGYDTCLIADDVAPAVQLNDSCAHHALTEILIRRTNEHLPHAVILGCFISGRGERIIRLIIDHWPHHYSHCFQCFLENGELREQLRRHTLTGLVSGIQIISKRFHDMIGCNSEVGCTVLDHGQDGGQNTSYCADFLPVRICCGGHREKMAEQFIRSVDQVHIHVVSDQILAESDVIRSGRQFWEIIPMLWTITGLGASPRRGRDSTRYALKFAKRIGDFWPCTTVRSSLSKRFFFGRTV